MEDRRIFSKSIKKYAIASVIVISIIIALFTILAIISNVGNPFFVVSSKSMIPYLNVGDLVVISKGNGMSFDDLKPGDIIVFHTTDGGGRTIVHRIVEIYSDQNGERLVKTKGDNNPISYKDFDYPIHRQDYYGKVVYVIPKVGLISTILRH